MMSLRGYTYIHRHMYTARAKDLAQPFFCFKKTVPKKKSLVGVSSAEACTTFSIRGTTSHRTLWPLDNKSVAAKTGATGNTTPPHAVLSCNARRRDGVQAAQQHTRVVPRGMGCGSGLGRSTQPRATALQPTHHQL